MKVLTIESSCDETSAAIVEDGHKLLANIIVTQIPVHAEYGGVVPELASRNHIFHIHSVIDEALRVAGCTLDDIDGYGATSAPGLIGSLLVGVETARGLAFAYDKPFRGLNHLEGHLTAVLLDDAPVKPNFPYLGVIVSGGHTDLYIVHELGSYTLLGRTRDDAAGEAFDKVAKMVGLPYPGGRIIDSLAKEGNPKAIDFPRPMIHSDDADFSFSGLKTAVLQYLTGKETLKSNELHDLAASIQEAICDVLTHKATTFAKKYKLADIVYSGGVSCNSRLRSMAAKRAEKAQKRAIFAPPSLCTDNAAMLAPSAYFYLRDAMEHGTGFDGWEVAAYSNGALGISEREKRKGNYR